MLSDSPPFLSTEAYSGACNFLLMYYVVTNGRARSPANVLLQLKAIGFQLALACWAIGSLNLLLSNEWGSQKL